MVAGCRLLGFNKMAQGNQTCTFDDPRTALNRDHNSTRRAPRKKRKERNLWQEKKKSGIWSQRRVSNAGCPTQGVRCRRSGAVSGEEGPARGGCLYTHTYTLRHHVGQKRLAKNGQTTNHKFLAKNELAKIGRPNGLAKNGLAKWMGQNWIGQVAPNSTLFMLLYSSVLSSCASLNSSCFPKTDWPKLVSSMGKMGEE